MQASSAAHNINRWLSISPNCFGKFSSGDVLRRTLEAAKSEIVTVALRRVDLTAPADPILKAVDPEKYLVVPNTSGARDAGEAVRIARMARHAAGHTWVKLEVTPNPASLLPDPIETLEAARNADAIIGTEGVDALFFGPDDMKVRMGIPVNSTVLDNPELREAMEQTGASARAAGKVCGTVAPSAALARSATDMGYQILVGGGDILFMRTAAAARLAELRDELKQETAPGADLQGGGGIYGG